MPLAMCPSSRWTLPVILLALLCCPGAQKSNGGRKEKREVEPQIQNTWSTSSPEKHEWTLGLAGSSEEAFEIHMWPEKLALETGGSLEINCSTSCAQPETGGLETTLSKELLAEEPQWKLYLVQNASEDTVVYCYFTCAGQQQSMSAKVTVFYPPEQVLLKLQPTRVAVGSTFILECRVPAVAPLESLTLTLLRDQQTLHSQTFGQASGDPQEAVVTHNATAGREDGRHSFSCRAELDLRALGGDLVSRVSEPRVLDVYGPPKQVLLRLQPTRVAVGSTFILECRVPAVAPLESLTLTLLRGQQTLHIQTFGGASGAPQEAVVTHNATAGREDGRHNFSCRAELDLRALGGDLVSRVSEPRVLDVYEPAQVNQTVIIVVVSLLLILALTSVLVVSFFHRRWRQKRTGTYGVQAASRRPHLLSGAQPV